MKFNEAMELEATKKRTENGAVAYNSTGDALLNLFGVIGALRSASDDRILNLFDEAYEEDPLLAVKTLFYARDIRGGLGERDTFRKIIHHLAKKNPEVVIKNLHFIPEYGRFDDLYSLLETPCEKEMWKLMKGQFTFDLASMKRNESVSLLAKWIKTPDASSDATRKLGIATAKYLGYKVYDFKRLLRKLRAYIDVTEAKMSTKRWGEINYEHVPSRAMLNYRHAFNKHDNDRFLRYLSDVNSGKAKINSGTLYPYDIVKKILFGFYISDEENAVLEQQWKAIPNYVDPGTNAIVIADTSWSMTCNNGMPLASAVGLALYFAERNVGPFHGLFMTFSDESRVVKINERKPLRWTCKSIEKSSWGGSTNLHAAFDKVLFIARNNKCPKEEVPKSIIVITDMEINNCGCDDWDFYDIVKAEYEAEGYNIPNIVFWNVNSRNDTYLVDSKRKGVQLISGSSPSSFANVISCIGMTPYESMIKILSSDRYSKITV